MLRIIKCSNNRSLQRSLNIGTNPQLCHFFNQNSVVFCIAGMACRNSSLFFHFLQCLRKGQNNMSRRSKTPFSVFFHGFPLVIEIQRQTACLTLTFLQFFPVANNKGKSRNTLNAFIGTADNIINSQLLYRDIHSSKAGHGIYNENSSCLLNGLCSCCNII